VDVQVLDSRIYALDDKVTSEKAGAKAEELKGKAFGLVSALISRPKSEDIEVKYIEKRYEPFWHILCRTHLEYQRGREYKIDLESVVRNVNVDGIDHTVDGGKIVLNGMEHCVEDLSKEVFVDASTGEKGDYSKYLSQVKNEIQQTEELIVGETIVVPVKVKASYLTREVITDMLKPVKADDITTEEIRIEKLHLYFRPVYAFEYLWRPKEKAATLELDAVTMNVKTNGITIKKKMKELLSEADLFDIGTEAVNLFVPGGGLALKIARRAMKGKKK
jgi:hypothetical protein